MLLVIFGAASSLPDYTATPVVPNHVPPTSHGSAAGSSFPRPFHGGSFKEANKWNPHPLFLFEVKLLLSMVSYGNRPLTCNGFVAPLMA